METSTGLEIITLDNSLVSPDSIDVHTFLDALNKRMSSKDDLEFFVAKRKIDETSVNAKDQKRYQIHYQPNQNSQVDMNKIGTLVLNYSNGHSFNSFYVGMIPYVDSKNEHLMHRSNVTKMPYVEVVPLFLKFGINRSLEPMRKYSLSRICKGLFVNADTFDDKLKNYIL
jgi:hypothetical protein